VTGNIQAAGYSLSAYEMALNAYNAEDIPSGHEFMKIHLSRHSANRSANMTSAVLSNNNGYYRDAELYFKKAIDFAPTDFFLHLKLGEFYIKMYNRTSNIDFRNKAVKHFDDALRYNKGSSKLEKDIKKLLMEGAPSGT